MRSAFNAVSRHFGNLTAVCASSICPWWLIVPSANRPSRRQDLIEAAVELFSLQPWDFVTVADIVERAGMTPAAFYYHFSSREQLLEEIVAGFAEEWVAMIDRLLAVADTADALSYVPIALLDEVEQDEQSAKIFFLS